MVTPPLFFGSPPTAGPQPRDVLRLARPLFFGSPRTAGPQPRDVLRLARPSSSARLRRRGPSPATSCGSHDLLRLASDGGAPAPRRPAARTTMIVCAQASPG